MKTTSWSTNRGSRPLLGDRVAVAGQVDAGQRAEHPVHRDRRPGGRARRRGRRAALAAGPGRTGRRCSASGPTPRSHIGLLGQPQRREELHPGQAGDRVLVQDGDERADDRLDEVADAAGRPPPATRAAEPVAHLARRPGRHAAEHRLDQGALVGEVVRQRGRRHAGRARDRTQGHRIHRRVTRRAARRRRPGRWGRRRRFGARDAVLARSRTVTLSRRRIAACAARVRQQHRPQFVQTRKLFLPNPRAMGFDVVAVTEGAASREGHQMRSVMGSRQGAAGTGFRLGVVAAALVLVAGACSSDRSE